MQILFMAALILGRIALVHAEPQIAFGVAASTELSLEGSSQVSESPAARAFVRQNGPKMLITTGELTVAAMALWKWSAPETRRRVQDAAFQLKELWTGGDTRPIRHAPESSSLRLISDLDRQILNRTNDPDAIDEALLEKLIVIPAQDL